MTPDPDERIPPCGGRLVDLLVPDDERAAAKAHAARLPVVKISERAVCDLEMLATGGFSPLATFMGRADYERVLGEMRLSSGMLWPVPVTLPVDDGVPVHLDGDVALSNARGDLLAVMTVEEIYRWDREAFARALTGAVDPAHPLVAESASWGPLHISGRLRVLQLPAHHDFTALRLTPVETRARLAATQRRHVVAFQTRTPLYRSHEALIRRALDEVDGGLLLHPVVGLVRPGDTDHYTRVRTYQALVARRFDAGEAVLALLPLAMRMVGPREALWHALVRRNYGATHLIVGRGFASPGPRSDGRPFYDPDAAHDLVSASAGETGVRAIPYREYVYLPDEDRYEEAGREPAGARAESLSGIDVREQFLRRGRELPSWFVRPEVAEILAETYRPRHLQGACVWFTGLSGAGKSTTAEVLTELLAEHGRRVTVLDGDIVRTHLSKGLGFSRDDRDTNIRRIGFVAAEVVRHGGVAVCAAVSPYVATREEVRNMVGPEHFIEVYVDTPIEVCERRDIKGMYAKARRGEIRQFTGVDDPYEPPPRPALALDTVATSPFDNAMRIVGVLRERGFLRANGVPDAD